MILYDAGTDVDQTLECSGAMVLHWPQSMQLMDQQFYEFCRVNKELRIERTSQGDCEIMSPTGGETSWRNSRLITALSVWADREGSGVVFDSSGGFILPNGAIRSPDVSWVKKEHLAILTAEQKKRFLPLAPNFVIELRSPSDSLQVLQDKMQEYIEYGVSLGWLIDSDDQQVYVFQVGSERICLDNPQTMFADELLSGFELDMGKVWNVGF